MEQQQQQQGAALSGAFNQFINLMNKDEAKDLVRAINMFMKDFKARPPEPEADSRAVQAFLAQMEGAMARHPLFAASTPAELDAATEALEKYLMTKLHARTFGTCAADRERDAALAVRCAALAFVTPAHLEVPDGLVNDAALSGAAAELGRINAYKAPRDKLVCILNCCRMINASLARTSKGDGIGADDFTPLLILAVLRAAPPALASNLAFIERFRAHARLASEAQYYYITLCGAASFIESINASSLKVEPDEFLAHMLAAGAMSDDQLEALGGRGEGGGGGGGAAGAMTGAPAAAAAGAAAASAGGAHPARDSIARSNQAAAAAAAAAGIRQASDPWQQQQQYGGGDGVLLQMQALPPVQQQQQQQQVAPYPSVGELEARGAALLSARGAGCGESMVARHPFCCASLDSLSIADCGRLLAAYKELVLRHESLLAALEQHADAAAAAAAQLETPQQVPQVQPVAQQPVQHQQQQHAMVGADASSTSRSSGSGQAPAAGAAHPPEPPAVAQPQQQAVAQPQQHAAAPAPPPPPPPQPPAAAAAEPVAAMPAPASSNSVPAGPDAPAPPAAAVDDLLASLLLEADDGGGSSAQQPSPAATPPQPQAAAPAAPAVPPAAAAAAPPQEDEDMFGGLFVAPQGGGGNTSSDGGTGAQTSLLD